MSRFGSLKAIFYAPSDVGTPLEKSGGGTTLDLLEANTDQHKDQQGNTSALFHVQADWDDLVAEGNICAIYYTDTVLTDDFPTGVPFCAPFIIQNATPFSDERGDLVRIDGPDLLEELKNTPCWDIIAEENTVDTTADDNVAAPVQTTLSVGAPSNNDSAVCTSVSGVEVGDEVLIEMNNGDFHSTVVTAVNPPTSPSGTIQYRDRLPYNADSGNDVEFRKRVIPVDSTDGMATGLEVEIELDDTTIFETFIEDVDTAAGTITIQNGVPDSVTSGNDVIAYDYSQPALDDIDRIIALDSDWSVQYDDNDYTGTASGTRHPPDGLSLYELLQAAKNQSGEFFRLHVSSAAGTVVRRILWKRTYDFAGSDSNLRLTVPTQANAASDAADPDRGIIYGSVSRRRHWNPATRVYPFSGDERVTLAGVSAVGLAYATLHGYTIVTTGLGKYEPPYIRDNSMETNPDIGIRARTQTFTHIRSENDQVETIQTACDALLFEAVNYLFRHQQAHEYYEVNDAVCRPVYPGQRVELVYTDPLGHWSVSKTGDNALYVLSVSKRMGPVNEEDGTGGEPYTTLTLSNLPYEEPTVEGAIANSIVTIDQLAKRAAGAGSTVVVSGGSGGGGGTTDHGALDGLADDDHAQYVLTSGAGDGLAYNASIRGFEIDRLGGLDSGLGITTGKIHIATPGTLSAGSTASVGPNHTHPVTTVSDGQTNPEQILKTTASGGVRLAWLSLNTAGGTHALQLDGRIAYAGTNELYFSGAGAATINNTGQTISVVSTDITLDPSSQTLTVDGSINLTGGGRNISTASGSITLDPANAILSVDGTLNFTGGARSINTSSGDLTIEPAADLEINPGSDVANIQASTWLKTSNHTSGHLGAGWGITYTGEMDMRYIRADELHVLAFIADIARVSVGEHWVTPSMAEISRDFTIPAVSSSATLYVHDIPGFEEAQAFAPNDYVMIRVLNRSGGGLQAWLAWGQVTNYTNLSDAEQSWTFTTRSLANAAAAGKIANAGGIALGMGKSGDGWWRTTAIGNDTPYSEVVTWEGNPYTSGNRRTRMRLGNLKGVTGKREWGIHAGLVDSNKIVFSDLRNEIHGTRLSLYANDLAEARVSEIEIRFTYDGGTTADRAPDSDGVNFQAAHTGAAFWSQVNSGYDSATSASYIYNEPGKSGEVWMGLDNGPSWTTLQSVSYRIRTEGAGFSDDNVRGYIQIFRADQRTPLTSEELFRTYSANSFVGTGTVAFSHVDLNTVKADWDGAWVRIRWEYVATTTPEAIRLDPFVPSLAVGTTLPLGMTSGGNGLWVGREFGVYRFRVGVPNGARLQWNGTTLGLYDSNDVQTIAIDSSGNSYFAGPMTLGTNGGIWQGTGTFASPTTGLKIWRDGSVGRLATYNSSTLQVGFDTSGNLIAGGGAVVLNANGIRIDGTNEGSTYTHVSSTDKRLTFRDASGVAAGYIAGVKSVSAALGVRIGAAGGVDAINIYEGLNHRWKTGSGSAIQLHPGSAGVQIGDGVTAGSGNLSLDGGLIVGPIGTAVNPGQIVSDVEGAGGWQAFFLVDTVDVAHGMTDITSTNAYGRMGKNNDANGGLLIDGLSEAGNGINLHGYVTTENTGTATGSTGNVNINTFLKSGTGVTSHGSTANIFTVRNNSAAQLILKGNGDLHVNGSGSLSTFDEYEDAELVRAVDLSLAGQIDSEFGAMLRYGRADIERAGLATFDDNGGVMVNLTRVQRLLMGGLWQQAERIRDLEATVRYLQERLNHG